MRGPEIIYQGFSLLTANREVLAHPAVAQIAADTGGHCEIIFRFALDVGMIPLTGTTDPAHMQADLDVFDFSLAPEEVARIETLVVPRGGFDFRQRHPDLI